MPFIVTEFLAISLNLLAREIPVYFYSFIVSDRLKIGKKKKCHPFSAIFAQNFFTN